MSSFSARKRSPFAEAPADLGNRKGRSSTPKASRLPSPSAAMKQRFSKAGPPRPRAPVSNILVKNGVRSKSRSRGRQGGDHSQHQLLPSPERTVSTADAHANPNNDATRARVYKAEAYEAKVRLASQEQRIEALQNELEEVKFFAMVEKGGSGDAGEREKKSRDDAELIEILAQEVETMEKDLEASKIRAGELESAAQSSEVREAELKKLLEQKQKQYNQAEKDVTQGMVFLREMEKELKAARSEREDALSQLSRLQSKTEHDHGERVAVVKELEVLLKSMRNERDGALTEISSLRKEVEELRECSARCAELEKSNEDLQTCLQTVQLQSAKKMEQIKVAIMEAQGREKTLKQDHENLVNSYDQKVEDAQQMQSTIDDLANQLVAKSAAVEELKELHATNITNMKEEHTAEMGEMKKKLSDMSSLEVEKETTMNDLRKDLAIAQTKNQTFGAIESNYIAEIASLKETVKELKRSAKVEAPSDELMSNLQTENSKLRDERDDLVRKLQMGLEIHKRTTTELEEKTLELQSMQSSAEESEALKEDYTSAVELSISRGKKIQSLEKEVETYHSQLGKAVNKIKKLEKKSQAAEERLQAEVSSLRGKVSHTEDLERDLAIATKENGDSQVKIASLEEALKDMEAALKTVTSRKLSPNKKHSSKGNVERRQQIEDTALAEYYAQRMANNGH